MSERRVCKMLSHPRSTQRYQPYPSEDKGTLTEDIVELASRFGRYGYRRVTVPVRPAFPGGSGSSRWKNLRPFASIRECDMVTKPRLQRAVAHRVWPYI